jgi:hypothetical protein
VAFGDAPELVTVWTGATVVVIEAALGIRLQAASAAAAAPSFKTARLEIASTVRLFVFPMSSEYARRVNTR